MRAAFGICFAVLAFLRLQPALAAEPAAFSIISQGGTTPTLVLNDTLKLRLGPGDVDTKKANLRIGDHLLNVEPQWLADRRELHFKLKRTDGPPSNRAMWSALLGSPLSDTRTIQTVALLHNDKAVPFAKPSAPDEAVEAKVALVKANLHYLALALLMVAVVVVGVCVFGANTAMLRDGPLLQQIPPTHRPFSLGRCQMAVWTCLIICSFLLVFLVLGDMSSINAESFILMGVSATTALGAVAIDRAKDTNTTQVQTLLAGHGLNSSQDVLQLEQAIRAQPTEAEKARWTAYRDLTKDYRSETFIRDLITDKSGPTLHRFQVLAWTVILAAIYVGLVYTSLETPTFGTNLLALMGISGGIYVGFKIPEKQT